MDHKQFYMRILYLSSVAYIAELEMIRIRIVIMMNIPIDVGQAMVHAIEVNNDEILALADKLVHQITFTSLIIVNNAIYAFGGVVILDIMMVDLDLHNKHVTDVEQDI